MEAWVKYLQPDNSIARTIIGILLATFILWLMVLVFRWVWLKRQQRQMLRCADVEILKQTLPDASRKERKTAEEPRATPSAAEARLAFLRFCDAKFVKEDSLLARHVRAIFDAGLTEGRLEISELIKYTSNELFRWNGFLRSVLATFIVFGLLGTLFGLADSLSQLSPVASAGAASPNAELSLGLSHLLSQLKSAFAPSICGVSFTIFGLILFTAYLQFACAPLRNSLERLTLTVWVPQLFPTTSQRLEETLQLSKQQLMENLVAARDVVAFSKSIHSEVNDLNETFKTANEALSLLARSSNQINAFADKFMEGVNSLSPFQAELRALYKQMREESSGFHKSVKDNMEGAQLFQTNVQAILVNQNRELQSMLTALRAYEDSYLTTRKVIDTRLEEVLDSAKNAFDVIGERNRELVEAIGNPLREDLTRDLNDLRETLETQLKAIQNKFGEFDVPINSAARTMADTLETLTKQTGKITKELRVEIRQQDQKNRDQLQHLGELNKHIEELLRELPAATRLQSEQARTLNEGLSSLAENFATFGGSILAFGNSLNLTGEHLQQWRRLEEQNKQIVIALERLSSGSRSQDEQYQTLIKKVTDVEREVGVLSTRIESSSQGAKSHVSNIGYDDRFVERKRPSSVPTSQPNSIRFESEHKRSSATGLGKDDGTPASWSPQDKVDSESAGPREYHTTSIRSEDEGELTPPGRVRTWIRRLTSKLPFVGGR